MSAIGLRGPRRALLTFISVALAACGEHDAAAPAAGSPDERATSGSQPVAAASPAAAGSATAPNVEPAMEAESPESAVSSPRETLGRVVTSGGVVDVGLVFDGRVRTLTVNVGDALASGAVLAEVEVPALATAAAEAQGLQAQRGVLLGQRERATNLLDEGLGSRAAIDSVDTALAELDTRREMALALLSTANITPADRMYLARHGVLRVRAPRAGVVVELLATEGGAVGQAAPLARLVGPSAAMVQITTARRPPEGPATIVTDDGEVRATPTQPPVLDPSTGLFHTFYPLERALPHGARVMVRFTEVAP